MSTEHKITKILKSQKRTRRIYAKPSDETLQFLRDFARNYIPDYTTSSGKTNQFLN